MAIMISFRDFLGKYYHNLPREKYCPACCLCGKEFTKQEWMDDLFAPTDVAKIWKIGEITVFGQRRYLMAHSACQEELDNAN